MAESTKQPGPVKIDSQEEEPLIKFGDAWVPAHHAWNKMETASTVAEVIDHFNTHFPHLSTERTRQVVPTVRKRLKDVQLRMPSRKEAPDVAGIASELIQEIPPEDVLDEIKRDQNIDITLRDLISLVGEESYMYSLQREAKEYETNRISPDQTAQIWNEMARPSPGGGLWNQRKVERLLAGQALE